MTEITHSDELMAEGRPRDAWRFTLRKVGLVYLLSRLCVAVGAAIVAAELRADENKRLADFPFSLYADPHYVGKPIPRSAVRPMLDVLTSWDGVWYMRIVRNGYPTSVRPNVTYFVEDARAAFSPTYPMLVRFMDRILPGSDTLAALFTNFVLGAVAYFFVYMNGETKNADRGPLVEGFNKVTGTADGFMYFVVALIVIYAAILVAFAFRKFRD